MAEFYEVLEIVKNGSATGKFRRTVRSDEPVSNPIGLCDHDHDSQNDAFNCPVAISNLPKFMRPKSSEELFRIRIHRIIQQYKLQQPESQIEIIILKKDKNDPKVIQSQMGDDLKGSLDVKRW